MLNVNKRHTRAKRELFPRLAKKQNDFTDVIWMSLLHLQMPTDFRSSTSVSISDFGSSLIYNTSARHERHEWHECKTSKTWATRVRHECYTNDTSATRVKNFDFHNNTSKNIFSHPYIYYMASERLQGEEQFHFKN